jgi:hypothetical protein
MATAPKIKTKFIEKTHEKVWNITDHPQTDVKVQNLMVAGKAVLPGQAVKVPLEVLEDAKKLQQLVEAKMVHIGSQPPADYLAAKESLRAVIPAGASRAHGERNPGGGEKVVAALKAAPAKVAVELADTVAVSEKVEVAKAEEKKGNGGRGRR